MTNYLELLYLIAFIGVLAVAYSYLLSGQIISSSAGNNRMQEIAEAIQIGAKASLLTKFVMKRNFLSPKIQELQLIRILQNSRVMVGLITMDV